MMSASEGPASSTRLTATTSLARKIDQTERLLVVAMAEAGRRGGVTEVEHWPIAGGAAVLWGPGSPFNKVIAVGFDGLLDPAAWASIESVHADRGVPLQVELSTLADPSVAAWLTERGYRLVGFENVLARELGAGAPCLPVPPAGVSIAIVDAAADASAAWRTVLTTGFLHPDVIDGPPSHESFDHTALERTWSFFETLPGVVRTIACIGVEAAGGASLFIHDDVALLTGAATLPSFRRRGVQSALLMSRLAMARDAGCRLAVVTTQPGSKSQQNVQRLGFDLIYSRAILVKTPPPAS